MLPVSAMPKPIVIGSAAAARAIPNNNAQTEVQTRTIFGLTFLFNAAIVRR
jgi:hypothetical protein